MMKTRNILKCGLCGKNMSYQTGDKTYVYCQTKGCPNKGSYLDVIEGAVLENLKEWLERNRNTDEQSEIRYEEAVLHSAETDMKTLERELKSVKTYLDLGVYDADIYTLQRDKISGEISKVQDKISAIKTKICDIKANSALRRDMVEKVEHLIKNHDEKELSDVIEKITYVKDKHRGIDIKIYPLVYY